MINIIYLTFFISTLAILNPLSKIPILISLGSDGAYYMCDWSTACKYRFTPPIPKVKELKFSTSLKDNEQIKVW